MKIILASKSPRRREVLSSLAREIGFQFDIIVKETDETVGDIHPRLAVEVLAVKKGAAVAEEYPEALVISSDTLVELDGVPLGKPCEDADAYRMLSSLSGRSHNVHTGVAIHYKGKLFSGVATSAVYFRHLSDEEIDEYVESGNWTIQLYIREGRRMVGEYVMTQKDIEKLTKHI